MTFPAPFTLANPACTDDDQQNEEYNKQCESACKTATVATAVASRITAKAHNLAPPLSNQDTFIKYAAHAENESNLCTINENAYSIKYFLSHAKHFLKRCRLIKDK